MAEISNDELLAKVASEKGVEPLAHTLGVKLADAEQILDAVWQNQFFNDMAKLGHVANTEEEAVEMLKVALEVEQLKLARDAEQAAESSSEFKEASEILGEALGNDEVEAEKVAIAGWAADTAELMKDDNIVGHLVAALDAKSILDQ